MAWIEYHTQLRNHWKIERLSTALKLDYPTALGMVSCLWCWVAEFIPDGNVSKFTDAEIGRACRWPGDASALKQTLEACGLLDADGGIHDWKAYGLRLLLSNRTRVSKWRQKIRDNPGDKITLQKRPTNLTIPNQTILTEEERRRFFIRPLPEEVTAYAKEIGFECNGQEFCDFYQSKGWVVGKNAMKDWRAALRNWRARDVKNRPVSPATISPAVLAAQKKREQEDAKYLADSKVFDETLAKIKGLPKEKYDEIYAKALKRLPPKGPHILGFDTILLPAALVEVYREI